MAAAKVRACCTRMQLPLKLTQLEFCIRLQAAGFDTAFLKAVRSDLASLKAVGFDAVSLKAAGFDAASLKAAGFDAASLKAARFDAASLKAAGFDAASLKAARFDAASLKAAGFDAASLKAAGFDATSLFEAGFSDVELRNASNLKGQLLKKTRHDILKGHAIRAFELKESDMELIYRKQKGELLKTKTVQLEKGYYCKVQEAGTSGTLSFPFSIRNSENKILIELAAQTLEDRNRWIEGIRRICQVRVCVLLLECDHLH